MSSKNPRQEPFALVITRWIGSPASVALHSAVFVGSFALAYFGVVEWERTLLVVTTIVSLEAIYLSIFIQMSLNHANRTIEAVEEDIDEIQEDVDEIQKDIDEIQEDVDEIQEDIDDIEEAEEEDEERDRAQNQSLEQIKQGLAKLMQDIENAKNTSK